jgi:hypothetical protein
MTIVTYQIENAKHWLERQDGSSWLKIEALQAKYNADGTDETSMCLFFIGSALHQGSQDGLRMMGILSPHSQNIWDKFLKVAHNVVGNKNVTNQRLDDMYRVTGLEINPNSNFNLFIQNLENDDFDGLYGLLNSANSAGYTSTTANGNDLSVAALFMSSQGKHI